MPLFGLSFEETRALFKEANKYGIEKKVATHPLYDKIWDPFTMDEVREIVKYGCYIEHNYSMCLPPCGSVRPEVYVEAIEAVGAENTIMCTDFAQITDCSPAEGMRYFIATMLQLGVPEKDVELMVKINPAKLLDMDI